MVRASPAGQEPQDRSLFSAILRGPWGVAQGSEVPRGAKALSQAGATWPRFCLAQRDWDQMGRPLSGLLERKNADQKDVCLFVCLLWACVTSSGDPGLALVLCSGEILGEAQGTLRCPGCVYVAGEGCVGASKCCMRRKHLPSCTVSLAQKGRMLLFEHLVSIETFGGRL